MKLYKNGDIQKLTVGTDPKYERESPPDVNRISAHLKGRLSILVDWFKQKGIIPVEAGIGDCDAGYSLMEVALAILALVGVTIRGMLEKALMTVVSTFSAVHIHLPYGDVRGIPSLITGVKGFLGEVVGFEIRDYLTVTHGGRAGVFMALRSQLGYMKWRLAEKALEAIRDHKTEGIDALAAILIRYTGGGSGPQKCAKRVMMIWKNGGNDALVLKTLSGFMHSNMAQAALKAISTLKDTGDLEDLVVALLPYAGDQTARHCAADLIEAWEGNATDELILNILFEYVRPMVAVPVPTWGTYPNIVKRALGEDAIVLIISPDGRLVAERLDELCAANPRISMLVFCNPVNPTGVVYSADLMARICRVLFKHGLACHADDMYSMFSWAHEHRSILQAAAAMAHSNDELERRIGEWVAAHTTMLCGVMKAGGSGSRVNFVIIPNDVLRSIWVAIQGDMYGPPPIFSQWLQLIFIQHGGPERVYAELEKRRNHLQGVLERIQVALAGMGITFTFTSMEGGFYAGIVCGSVKGKCWKNPDGKIRVIRIGEDFADAMLELCGLVISPDIAACIVNPEFARLAYGTLNVEGMDAMEAQLPKGLSELFEEKAA